MTYSFGQTSPRLIKEDELPSPTLVLHIGQSLSDYIERCGLPEDFQFSTAHIMSFTQRAWKLSTERASGANLILAVNNVPELGRVVLGAFVFDRPDMEVGKEEEEDNKGKKEKRTYKVLDSQYPDDDDRKIFLAEPAHPDVWRRFVGNYLPGRTQGEVNPVKYFEMNNQQSK